MTIEMITEGLRELLLENNYNPATIRFYEREWNKIQSFLLDEYGDTEYQMERGLKYLEISTVFMDYLTQLKIYDTRSISMETCNGYLKTQAGYSFKTVELNICGIRYFLRYLLSEGMVVDDFAEKIHMPPVSKTAKIPSAWTADELKRMISAIDRNSPVGKKGLCHDPSCMYPWAKNW